VRRLLLCALCASLGAAASAQEAVDVTVSKQGFRPATVRLRKGETVRLRLKTTDEEHCFAVDSLRLEKRIQPSKVTAFELTPDKAGSYPIYCCLEPDNETMRGRLVVAE
jgi:heme/copper-type cytochrome/quinol oxidase subunit 2